MKHTRNSQRIRRVALLAHKEPSAHQTSNPNIEIDICVHIRHFVPLQFKQCISRFFVKINIAMLMGAFFKQIYGDGSQIQNNNIQ